MRQARLILIVLGLCISGFSMAHEMRPALLELTEMQPGQYQILWKVPARGGKSLSIAPKLPPGCGHVSEPNVIATAGAFVRRWIVYCGDEGLAGRRITIVGLASKLTDVMVVQRPLNGQAVSTLIKPEQPWLEVGREPSSLETARRYTVLGVEHILLGVDHLLFVLGLLLIVRGGGSLVKTITAFTMAHSITLAAATLGFVNVPQAPVEAVIALSILFLATELVREETRAESLTRRFPWRVAFVFGLLHGFGFAGALSEVGLPQSDIPLALLTFNIGVELGQLLFIAAVWMLVRGAGQLLRTSPAWVPRLTAYGIGSVSSFWVIERVLSL